MDTAENLAAQFEQAVMLAAVSELIALLMVSSARVHLESGQVVQAQDTLGRHERQRFHSQWSGGRKMITRERLYIAARHGEPARTEALVPHMPNHAAARPGMDSRTEMLSTPWLGRIQLALQHHRLDRATDLP